MNSRRNRRILCTILLTMGLLIFKGTSFAQQVTYYDFDAPNAANAPGAPNPGNGSSLTCGDPAKGTLNTPNPLFCLNNGGGSNPGFLSDIYPAIIDPNTMDNPPMDSTHYATGLTASDYYQAASMWFSVPQKISNGFTSYFAFKISNPGSYATADGIAFVIQNAAGGGSENNGYGEGPCTETGSGPTVVGGTGGCIGYGGLDNSLAVELDTFKNGWDPQDSNVSTYNNTDPYNGNHIAVENCGAGLVNSPDHGSCLVQLPVNGVAHGAINGALPITLADGAVHQVVVQYSGPTEATPNLLQIFIDPPFVTGTHTPTSDATPVISGVYDISANLNLMNSGTANDSAYVGFTSSTGGAFEKHELMAWTFTPHSPVTQQQPLNPPGTPTTFPFGSHVYAVTYPVGGPSTSEIDMVVTANTITPTLFSQLISGSAFAGSVCQVYDETGGNCIVYSTSCVTHGTNTVVQCPASTDPGNLIDLKSAYNNTVQPISPGFLKGDPFYSLITSIAGGGTTATVTCLGECSVTPGQTVTIAGNVNGDSPSPFNGSVTVLSADPSTPNIFTFTSASNATGTGGYLTSNNLENAFNSYVPERIDGTTTGKTKNFSDFVVTAVTSAVTSMTIVAPSVSYGNSASVVVTVSSGAGTPTGNVTLSVDGGPVLTQALSSGSATFSIPLLSGGLHSLSANYAAQDIFQAASKTASLNITTATPLVTFTGAPSTAAYASTFVVAASTNASTLPLISAGGACSISGNTVTMTSGTGTCSLLASWAGDGNFNAATASQSTVATKATSVTTITSDTPNPSTSGSAVTVAFKVTGTGLPTGAYSVTGSAGDPSCSGTLSSGLGSCSLTFLTPGVRTITVAYAGDSNFVGSQATVQQTVNGPVALVTPTSVNFGTVYLGTLTVKNVTLMNIGSGPMTIKEKFLSIIGGGNSNEFVALSLCPQTLAVGKSCTILVTFVAGPNYTPQTATLMINDNAPGSPQSVALSASVINPQASFNPTAVNFGTQNVGTASSASIKITSSGNTALNITNIGISGANASDFTIVSNNCPGSLTANAYCTVTVKFVPGKTGTRSANLNVNDNVWNGSQQVSLTGKGK